MSDSVDEATALAVASLNHADGASSATAAGVEADRVAGDVDPEALRAACQDAKNAQARYLQLANELEAGRASFEASKQREEKTLDRRKSQIEQKDADLTKLKNEVQNERAGLTAERVQLEKDQKEQAKRDGDIAERERAVREREIEAEAGFASRNRDMLAALETEKSDLEEAIRTARTELAAARSEIGDARARWSADQHDQVRAALDRIAQQQKTLDDARDALTAEKAVIGTSKRDVELRERDIDEDRREIDATIAHAMERDHANLLLDNERLRARISALTETLSTREREVSELQTVQRRAQGRSPEELLRERDALQEKVEGLEVELAERPGSDDLRRLREMERLRASEELEIESLRQKTAALQLRADRADRNAVEVDSLRATKESYEAEIALLSERLRLLGGEIEKHHGTSGPFPLCTRLDGEPESTRLSDLQRVQDVGGLGALADAARHHMAQRDPALFYDERTVRLFLAGLATSQLALLEGISGTGKSSLPEAFAAAIGGVSRSVAVQASWRDRHDILGHYNAFERQFAESDLLRHLYQAQLPAYADRPFLVVLDEMNLARPEYYFADFLSVLEDRARLGDDGEVFLGLVDNELAGKPLPQLLRRSSSGISLKLPDNVWFVGTANQDESTLKFAPKTYDRAHVMELPRSPDRFDPARPEPMHLSWRSLENAFREAAGTADTAGTHSSAAADVWERLTVMWEGRLADDFKLSWGNRLERQVRRFAPVLAAAGGTPDEAVDHVLSTKVLSRLKGRFDLDPDKLSALVDDLPEDTLPFTRSLVETELARIEA